MILRFLSLESAKVAAVFKTRRTGIVPASRVRKCVRAISIARAIRRRPSSVNVIGRVARRPPIEILALGNQDCTVELYFRYFRTLIRSRARGIIHGYFASRDIGIVDGASTRCSMIKV